MCFRVLAGDTSSTHAAKKEKGPKSQHNAHLRFTFAGRVQSKLDNSHCFWDEAEGVSRTTRHMLQFVDVVGLKPLSGMRFSLVTHGAGTKTALFGRKARTSAVQCGRDDVCGSCATNRTQNALKIDTCSGFMHDLTILAFVWAADGVVPRFWQDRLVTPPFSNSDFPTGSGLENGPIF